ncbi:MAG: long-chain fatty acid--CoA ligase [Owenweeksia sp.]|nr:long-chain fatty acid--CoA ligase [Owenweeksia sp.]
MAQQLPTRLFDFPRYQLKTRPLKDSLANKINGKWTPISTQEYVDMADQAGRALIDYGIKAGDKIALISTANRWEWNVMDMGILQAGAIDVPVYPTISEKDYEYIFKDAGVRMCFVSDKELFQKLMNIREKIPTLEEVYVFDQEEGVPYWLDFINRGEEGTHQAELEKRMQVVKEDDLATLIYTSGTTGTPKGVMLSHKNIASNATDCDDRIPNLGTSARALSFLPLCHVYERMLIYLYVRRGISIYYAESMETVGDNIRELKPDIFTAVPRLLEKVFDRILAKGQALSGLKKGLFFWAVALGEKFQLQDRSPFYNLKLAIARKLIFSKWQEALGGNVKAIVSGSAALNPRIIRIFMAAGFNVQEGYGLTESSPVIAVNGPRDDQKSIGSVGRPINNVQVKIASDRKIICKGPNVMMGYYKKPEQTREVLDEQGWLHTGDIGEMVQGEFLKITDRKKEIFKTSGGKYIAPTIMETKFKESRFIEQIMIIGEGEKHPAAIIQPDFEFLKEWADRKEITYASDEKIVEDERVRAVFTKEVDKKNTAFGHWEQIKKFELCGVPWTIEGKELTPTLKLKRRVILEKYADLYQKDLQSQAYLKLPTLRWQIWSIDYSALIMRA